ncbi:hypothetical protein [Glaciimonas sp. PCH181]|uniref:hypothetical protein n=1 Tax=Glaciimonas sp. PCH181 TaxID=2133943 RepID=UPI000D38A7CE|nr:hypothetical protein [Glaciimonas sp. PCH181]PUA19575.1 hypothetical protein C7W93_06940 [Glaciimonas sp. PCH181]
MGLNPPVISQVRQPRGIVTVQGHNADGSSGSVIRLNGWVRWEVDNNTFYEADTFRVTFALSALPSAYADAWWANQQEVFVEIFAGFPTDPENYAASDLQSLTYGRVDDVSYDPVARTLEVSGRDLTATMIDAKTSETFQNLSSSQIATLIALRHGLTPIVTKTPGLSGKFYQIDNVRMNQQRSEWDILTALAGEEQFSVYVKGKELHFEPSTQTLTESVVVTPKPSQADIDAQQTKVNTAKAALEAQVASFYPVNDRTVALLNQYKANPSPDLDQQLLASQAQGDAILAQAHAVQKPAYDAELAKLKTLSETSDSIQRVSNAYVLTWEPPSGENGAFGFNGKSISFSRALTLARGVVVTVQSVSPKTGKAIKVTFPAKAANIKPGQSTPQAQQYSCVIAHLTYEKALQKAQEIHAGISQHEVKLTATLPADNLLQPTNLIQVIGTGTAFDQTYYPESVTREMDISTGYTMSIRAKNHSPQSVIPL